MCRYESEVVGIGGDKGDTYAALERVLALGALATPFLVRLAHSKNAVSRMAAIEGFSKRTDPVAQRELHRLSNDNETALATFGCIGSDLRVGDFASQALRGHR